MKFSQIRMAQVFLEDKINEHVGFLIDQTKAGEIDELLMSPDKLVKNEIGVQLYPHHAINLPLKNILDQNQEVIAKD